MDKIMLFDDIAEDRRLDFIFICRVYVIRKNVLRKGESV